jgi:uncharacterized protein YjiS (DUF1127 family)
MAYVNSTSSARPSFGDRLAALITVTREASVRRALYRRTVTELEALSDRDLRDLGMARSNIRSVAEAAAYGK